MKNATRRNFLKQAGLTGLGIMGASVLKGNELEAACADLTYRPLSKPFNMAGFKAPPIEHVRVAVIGLGQRGPSHVRNLIRIEGVEVVALCDVVPSKAVSLQNWLVEKGEPEPQLFTEGPEDWKRMLELDHIDLVVLTTPWYMHAGQAVFAMEAGKHVASEVPAAGTLQECWQLVETSERTRRHMMMLENYSYQPFQLLTLNMAREGYFGEIVHGDCAYNANKMRNNFSKNMYWDMWWLRQYASRKGNIYPTHGMGPVCQIMDINRGDTMDYLVSVESNDFQMAKRAEELAETDDFYKQFTGKDYRGNMNTTTIRTHGGRTIMVQHDATSERPGTHIHGIYGTVASCLEHPSPTRIAKGMKWLTADQYKEVEEKYMPEIYKRVGVPARQSGHGGSDLVMLWHLIDALRTGNPLDQDVYDAALWSSVVPLSQWSVINRSTVEVPDFTRGNWKTNPRNMDIELSVGGQTKLR